MDLSVDTNMTQSIVTGNAKAEVAPALAGAPNDWKYCLGLVLILSVAYLLIESGHWHAGADTAYYISIARSVAMGEGFRFNGGPVGRIPPLWPLVLAGAMKISTSFWFVNLIPAACLVGSAAMWYWIVRRAVAPARAFQATLLSSLLFYWFTSATQLRTEALFCLLFSGALLLAVQIGEGRAEWWRLAAAVLLTGLMVGVRWVGLTCWLPVAAAMISGQIRPRLNRQWIGCVLVAAVAVGAFVGFRKFVVWVGTSPKKAPVVQTNTTPKTGGADTPRPLSDPERKGELPDSWGPDDEDGPSGIQAVFTGAGMVDTMQRMGDSGKWLSSLLFMPMYVGVTNKGMGWIINPIGWFLIAMFGVCVWAQGQQRRWIWLAVLLYCGALVFRWKIPNPRYLVPVAPLLLLGTWMGLEQLAAWCTKNLWRRFWRFNAAAFVVALALCNGALWAVEAYVVRSDNFYEHYLAGDLDEMVAAAKYLNEHGIDNGQVAVSYYYTNLGRPQPRKNGQGLRSMHMLTSKGIRSVPKKICSEEPNEMLLGWAWREGVKYYLYRPPVSPWRAHHFRLPWWQRRATGQQEIPNNPGWKLYELTEEKAIPVELPDASNWPSHVPGI